jgi:hypothetical protein
MSATVTKTRNAFLEFFSGPLDLPRAQSKKQSAAVVDALEVLAEVRRNAETRRPDLVGVLDEINRAYITNDRALVTKKLREVHRAIKGSSNELQKQSLAEQRKVLAQLRASSKPFADYRVLDAPDLHAFLARETVSAADLAKALDITPTAVGDRREKGELLAIEGSKRGYKYPRWQMEPQLWKTLPPVLKLLQGEDPWDVLAFLQGQYPALGGRTPLELLREGDKKVVMDFARDAFALQS